MEALGRSSRYVPTRTRCLAKVATLILWLRQDLDYGPIYDLGKALMIIQKAYGLIPRMLGKGDAARVSRSCARRLLLGRPDCKARAHHFDTHSVWQISYFDCGEKSLEEV